MKRDDIKRYMSVALFATITSILVVEIGDTLKWWVVKETAYPLHNMSYLYGTNPILSMWILNFTYRRFWLFMIADAVLNLGFAYPILDVFLNNRGIFSYINATPLQAFLILTVHGILIYGYQTWQESIYTQSEISKFSSTLQPVLAKPLPEDEEEVDTK
jgi:hypothetical protein